MIYTEISNERGLRSLFLLSFDEFFVLAILHLLLDFVNNRKLK